MSKSKQGEVWYADYDGIKPRPVVILSDQAIIADIDVIIAKVTSHKARNDIFDIEINWEKAGLSMPSIVRVNKLHTIEQNELMYKIGTLTAEDFAKVKEAFYKII